MSYGNHSNPQRSPAGEVQPGRSGRVNELPQPAAVLRGTAELEGRALTPGNVGAAPSSPSVAASSASPLKMLGRPIKYPLRCRDRVGAISKPNNLACVLRPVRTADARRMQPRTHIENALTPHAMQARRVTHILAA
jgi:hypothetical protein